MRARPSSLEIVRDDRWLIVELAEPHEVLSSAMVNGGRGRSRCVAWWEVHEGELGPTIDAEALLRERLGARGIADAVAMMTGRWLDTYVDVERGGEGASARCIATAGLGNALRAGDPPTTLVVGTINLLVAVAEPLAEEALVEAVALVAEARTAAVLEAAVPSTVSGLAATGTGTDAIVVAAPTGAQQRKYVGKHTAIGSAIGAAVLEATRRAVAGWQREP